MHINRIWEYYLALFLRIKIDQMSPWKYYYFQIDSLTFNFSILFSFKRKVRQKVRQSIYLVTSWSTRKIVVWRKAANNLNVILIAIISTFNLIAFFSIVDWLAFISITYYCIFYLIDNRNILLWFFIFCFFDLTKV